MMCGHGDSLPELLVSSKLTNVLDMVGASNIDALRHERLGTALSQIAIRIKAVAEVKVSEETMRDIAH